MEDKKISIIYDLDETLCTKKKSHETYSDVKPIIEMIEQLNEFHDMGYEIIIYTARNMVTQKNDIGKVLQNVGEVTLKWLRDNNVKYDSIMFGKSYGNLYVDDKACINDPKEIERRINAIKNGTEKEYLENQKQLLNNFYKKNI